MEITSEPTIEYIYIYLFQNFSDTKAEEVNSYNTSTGDDLKEWSHISNRIRVALKECNPNFVCDQSFANEIQNCQGNVYGLPWRKCYYFFGDIKINGYRP